jgi:hypothetical protein
MKQAKLLLSAFLLTATIGVRAQLTAVPAAGVQKSPGHYIGEKYGGGIVFFIYDKGEHGLIAATADQSTWIYWNNGTQRTTGATGDGLGAGAMNTAMIVATQIADNPKGNFGAKLCADYSVTDGDILYGDWYLPSKYELNLLFLQKDVVGGFTWNDWYLSSSEIGVKSAWSQQFSFGDQFEFQKEFPSHVRAIRSF